MLSKAVLTAQALAVIMTLGLLGIQGNIRIAESSKQSVE